MKCAVFGCVTLSAAVSLSVAQQTVVFEDQTLDPASYERTFANGSVGQSWSFEPDGGNSGTNPDPFLRVTTNTNGPVVLTHINPEFVVDPGAGAIDQINLSIDARGFVSFGQGMGFGIAAEQDGTEFTVFSPAGVPGSGPGAFEWKPYAITDVSDGFFAPLAGQSGTLDFSANAAPITLGFWTGNSAGNTISFGFDNLKVEVIRSQCSLVDFARPFGLLDLDDVTTFVDLFTAQHPLADFDGNGLFDLTDVITFVDLFTGGCP